MIRRDLGILERGKVELQSQAEGTAGTGTLHSVLHTPQEMGTDTLGKSNNVTWE